MSITPLELELHPDAIICAECGHDCDLADCGDICICVEEYDEDDYLAYDADMRHGVYDDWPSEGDY